jgi:hypothetical protein
MRPIQEEGEFQVQIVGYGTRETQKSGSDSMAMRVAVVITHRRDPTTHEWIEVTDSVFGADGDIYFVRANGVEDVTKVEALMQATGWDGKTETLDCVDPITFLPLPADRCWKPKPCIARIKQDDYLVQTGKGGMRYRVDQLLPLDSDAPRIITETGARRRSAKAALAKARAIGVTAPPIQPPAEPGSFDGPDGVPF